MKPETPENYWLEVDALRIRELALRAAVDSLQESDSFDAEYITLQRARTFEAYLRGNK